MSRRNLYKNPLEGLQEVSLDGIAGGGTLIENLKKRET